MLKNGYFFEKSCKNRLSVRCSFPEPPCAFGGWGCAPPPHPPNQKKNHGGGKEKRFSRAGKNERLGGQKYTKYNKINNNSENFRGARLCQGSFTPPVLPYLRACQTPALFLPAYYYNLIQFVSSATCVLFFLRENLLQ